MMSRDEFPGRGEREEREVTGLNPGTEQQGRAPGARGFDSLHRTNTQGLKNTQGEGTSFALLTARPSHDHEDKAVPSPSRKHINCFD